MALVVWSGMRAYDVQKLNETAQTQLRDDLKLTHAKLDQSLNSEEFMKGQLSGLAIVLGKMSGSTNLSDAKRLTELLQKLGRPPAVNSVLDAMTNQQLQDSVLALVKQMRETDSQFERANREMIDRHWQAERAIPLEDKAQFTAIRNKNWSELLQLHADQDNEFRDKYLGRGVAVRDQMLKRIPPDKVPNVNVMHGPSSLEFGHLLGATTLGMIAYYLEQLALALPMK